VVPGIAVEEVEQVAACHGVDNLVNPQQPERVLGSMLVEISVIDTSSTHLCSSCR
jgi:hypothetical protein